MDYIEWLEAVWNRIKDDVDFNGVDSFGGAIAHLQAKAERKGIYLGLNKARDLLIFIATKGYVKIDWEFGRGIRFRSYKQKER